MLDFSNASMNNVILHKAGNKAREEELIISRSELQVSAAVRDLLRGFFLGHFAEEAFYGFNVNKTEEGNPVFESVKNIFTNSDCFITESQNIATQLFEAGNHPKIKSGDVYVAMFNDIVVDDELVDAVGIFKSESKQDFLKIETGNNGFDVKVEKGINLDKIDKACLIYNTEENFGYKINLIDNVNKQTEAQYWRNDFLGIEQRKDDFYQTQNYIDVCKGFVKEVFNSENEVPKDQQASLLNNSAQYFQENESFNKKDFEESVLKNPEVIEKFNDYQEKFQEEKKVEFADNFDISEKASKKALSKLKSVIKLDKNFHIYIHGDESKIRKGIDPETGMNFYQFFFEREE